MCPSAGLPPKGQVGTNFGTTVDSVDSKHGPFKQPFRMFYKGERAASDRGATRLSIIVIGATLFMFRITMGIYLCFLRSWTNTAQGASLETIFPMRSTGIELAIFRTVRTPFVWGSGSCFSPFQDNVPPCPSTVAPPFPSSTRTSARADERHQFLSLVGSLMSKCVWSITRGRHRPNARSRHEGKVIRPFKMIEAQQAKSCKRFGKKAPSSGLQFYVDSTWVPPSAT